VITSDDYVDRDPDTVAVYQRHPNIAQEPLDLPEVAAQRPDPPDEE
jgi:hypothetical protein